MPIGPISFSGEKLFEYVQIHKFNAECIIKDMINKVYVNYNFFYIITFFTTFFKNFILSIV